MTTKSIDHIINELIIVKDKKKISNYKIAKASKLHRSTVGRIFSKKSKPEFDTLIKIADALDYTIVLNS